jgi:ubiquinone biosynthesis protein COQ4
VTGLPVWVEGEVGLKGLEWANLGLPMAGLSLAAVVRLNREQRGRLLRTYLPWALGQGWGMRQGALLNVYWEEELEGDVNVLRGRLGIAVPPDLRVERRRVRQEKRRKLEGGG